MFDLLADGSLCVKEPAPIGWACLNLIVGGCSL
jgi:hypothetical protein